MKQWLAAVWNRLSKPEDLISLALTARSILSIHLARATVRPAQRLRLTTMQMPGGTFRGACATIWAMLRALAWVARASWPYILVALFLTSRIAIGQTLTGPEILSEQALNRVPQDFAGLPSVVADDPYVPPLMWPVDSPLGYTGPSGILPREM